jgi:hypothetical protein
VRTDCLCGKAIRVLFTMDPTDSASDSGTNTPVQRRARLPFGQPGSTRDVDGRAGAVDDSRVADYLLSQKLYLAALEMHQELIERNKGAHSVAPLNDFFRDESRIDSLATSESTVDASISSTLAGTFIMALFLCQQSLCCQTLVETLRVNVYL